jgi:nitrous oxidase accessory protein NosD
MDRDSNGYPIGVNRRTVLKGTAVVGGVSLSGVASATPGGGPPGTKGCDIVVPDDESTIQDGVAAAASGDTVCVTASGGPYTEQVVINKDLTLRGVDGPTIIAPSSPDEFTIPESGATWEPVVFAFGGSDTGGDVSGSGTVNVTVTGFTIDGDGSVSGDRAAGVLTRNVSGAVSENTVENMGVGGKETFGILTYGNSDLSIHGNDVSEYERGGIGANGDGGVNPAPTVDIRENTVVGSTGIEEVWAPNGIQIGFGAEGKIIDNKVQDNRWSSDNDGDWVASGIIVFESDGVQVKKNSVTNSDVGVSVGAWSWFLPSADNTKLIRNDIDDAHAGVVLQAVAWDGISQSDPSVSNNKVTNNTISDPDMGDDDVGVAVDASDLDPDFDPVVANNKVINNEIIGFSDQISDDGMGTKIHANAP